ncbi:hypothetical protein [Croceibacterium aestuarii]|uniref:hypothetical protein n=1 Tax=Croceibacterium aestuarii TaxID=3064139 RepID=UPI00272DF78D|nr:hypothetical protein [Croceibacterium sp. D39]
MKLLIAALATSVLGAVPASAQSTVLVIGERPAPRPSERHTPTLDQKIEVALDRACEKPFLRDLKGWQLYKDCRSEVRGEIDRKLAGAAEPAAITVALR